MTTRLSNTDASPLLSPGMQEYKYYSAAKTGYEHLNKDQMLQVPEHVKDQFEKVFVPDFTLGSESGDKKKNGSLTVIFSVWNTMVGTGMLTIPWAYSNSGLILGICKSLLNLKNSNNIGVLPSKFLHLLASAKNCW